MTHLYKHNKNSVILSVATQRIARRKPQQKTHTKFHFNTSPQNKNPQIPHYIFHIIPFSTLHKTKIQFFSKIYKFAKQNIL